MRSVRILALTLGALLLAGCTITVPVATPTETIGPKIATVTDLTAPLGISEADALVARGFQGSGPLGYLVLGCSVEVIKTTDRAAQVKVVSPAGKCLGEGYPGRDMRGTQGWVAKSALDIKP
jgi:hypothetical protein